MQTALDWQLFCEQGDSWKTLAANPRECDQRRFCVWAPYGCTGLGKSSGLLHTPLPMEAGERPAPRSECPVWRKWLVGVPSDSAPDRLVYRASWEHSALPQTLRNWRLFVAQWRALTCFTEKRNKNNVMSVFCVLEEQRGCWCHIGGITHDGTRVWQNRSSRRLHSCGNGWKPSRLELFKMDLRDLFIFLIFFNFF